ncbi:S1C family serine protease [Mycobacterium camsae]|uniref:S1C family serine protease n=1 Tax=Mycobacterium gordonae TaxID=1778 RepID=UPI001F11AF7D|nr:trypsin-like peptidase domain-containing protein [Mycobacterium gordonae]
MVLILGTVGLSTSPQASADVSSLLGGAKSAPDLVVDTTPVEPGVVRVDTEIPSARATGTGTGIVLSPDGVVLTNNHVIRGATTITVSNIGNGQRYPADVLGYDRKNDIAVLQLRGASGLPVAPTADSSSVRVGDPVTAVGFADGRGLTPASGNVRALNQSIVANDQLTGSSEQLSNLIDFDANVRPGDSGGPLVDRSGRVVGIVTAASETYQMTSTGGFAIPSNRALSVADSIRSGNSAGSVHVGPTGILGVAVTSGGGQGGVPVAGVLGGTPAEAAGLRSGDVITAVDGTQIADATELTDVIDRHRPNDTVSVTYLDGQRVSRTVPVALADGPPN